METFVVGGRNQEPFQFTWKPTVQLCGQVVVAFGGSGNLAEIFLYAAAACGATPVLVDLPPQDAAKRAEFLQRAESIARNIADISGQGVPLFLFADVTDSSDVVAVVEQIRERCGRIDVAVDFAGIHHPTFDLVKDDPTELAATFRKVIEINLTGAFVFTTAMARVMVPQRAGHMIHLCSSGSRASLYASYAYNASKHGLEGLVKTAAAQLAPFGVRVNAIAPGTVVTNLNRGLTMTDDGEFRPRAKSILAHTPTKQFITREGVAETLIAMCVPQRHLTGNVIFADDGYNIDGHSWPDGNEALFAGQQALQALYADLDRLYPRV